MAGKLTIGEEAFVTFVPGSTYEIGRVVAIIDTIVFVQLDRFADVWGFASPIVHKTRPAYRNDNAADREMIKSFAAWRLDRSIGDDCRHPEWYRKTVAEAEPHLTRLQKRMAFIGWLVRPRGKAIRSYALVAFWPREHAFWSLGHGLTRFATIFEAAHERTLAVLSAALGCDARPEVVPPNEPTPPPKSQFAAIDRSIGAGATGPRLDALVRETIGKPFPRREGESDQEYLARALRKCAAIADGTDGESFDLFQLQHAIAHQIVADVTIERWGEGDRVEWGDHGTIVTVEGGVAKIRNDNGDFVHVDIGYLRKLPPR